jgi:hypothetical protein
MKHVSLSVVLLIAAQAVAHVAAAAEPRFRLATFSADVTIPLNHRCMGVLPTKSSKILDPLYAHGIVLLGVNTPVVLVAVDWCEIRNGAYDQWREVLADAAGTTPERVLVCALHQHDAPVVDRGAARRLAEVGLPNELYDETFHDDTVHRVAQALTDSLSETQAITHFGVGQSRVEQVASNRRVKHSDGRVSFERGSRSGGDPFHSAAPDGEIDPLLKTISFWNGDTPIVAIHSYATHPMSTYGRGEVSADFVGLARQRRQRDDFSVKQIYVSGCSGDVTAGKYNDGSPEARSALIERMYQAMVSAWQETRRIPLADVSFRIARLELEFSADPELSRESLTSTLIDADCKTEDRILAAMGLASRQRVADKQPIDMPCLDFGGAQILLFPGESFVRYQLMAQQMRPDSFVFSIGYGECWPGYIPTQAAFADDFRDKWLWVAPGSESRMRAALKQVLVPN